MLRLRRSGRLMPPEGRPPAPPPRASCPPAPEPEPACAARPPPLGNAPPRVAARPRSAPAVSPPPSSASPRPSLNGGSTMQAGGRLRPDRRVRRLGRWYKAAGQYGRRGPGKPLDDAVELVAAIEAVGEAGELALGVLGADGVVAAGDRGLDVAAHRVHPPERRPPSG